MRCAIAFLFSFFLLCYCSKPRLRSKQQFAALYLEGLKKANPTVDFVLNTEATITVKKDSIEKRYTLDNSYKAYKDNPEMIEEILETYVASTSDIIMGRNITLNSIIPLVKSEGYLRDLKSARRNPDDMIFNKYNGELIIVYAEQQENAIRELTKERFYILGVSMDSLKQAALNNLDKIVPLINREGENGSYKITANGYYEASLILLPSFWAKETFPVDGEFVIAIPSSDQILVTGSNNKNEIEKLKRIAVEEIYRGVSHIRVQYYLLRSAFP